VPDTTRIELKDYIEMGHFYASLPLCDNGKREHMHACEAPPRFLHRGKEKSISIVAFPSPSSVPPASHGATPEITSCSYMASRVAKQSRQNKMVLEFRVGFIRSIVELQYGIPHSSQMAIVPFTNH